LFGLLGSHVERASISAGLLFESQAPRLALRIKSLFPLISLSPNKLAQNHPQTPYFGKFLLLRRNMNQDQQVCSDLVHAPHRIIVKRF